MTDTYIQSNQPEGVPALELTGERTLPDVPEENYWYRRHLVVYEWIAERVRGLKVADLDGIGAEAGFHHIVRAAELADRRPRTGTVTALAEVPTFRRLAGRIAHGGVRADVVAAAQIIDARFDDEGHLADARIEADVLFFQILHDASRGIEAKGTAAAEQDGVDARRSRHRTEQFRFPAGRAAAADVDSTGRTFREHEDRAACAALAVLGIAQAETVRPGHG